MYTPGTIVFIYCFLQGMKTTDYFGLYRLSSQITKQQEVASFTNPAMPH